MSTKYVLCYTNLLYTILFLITFSLTSQKITLVILFTEIYAYLIKHPLQNM